MTPLPWLLVAVAREHLFFKRRCAIVETLRSTPTRVWRCRLEGREFLLVETGVGGGSVERTLDWLHERSSAKNAVFAGFAGALVDDLRVGDAVVAREVVDPAGRSWPATLPLALTHQEGGLLTSDCLVATPDDKRALALAQPVKAVDMESSYFAAWCVRHAVPWACVRVISDEARTPVSKDVFDLLEDGRVAPWKLTKTLIARPRLIRELWRLGAATKIAARRIDEVLTAALGRM